MGSGRFDPDAYRTFSSSTVGKSTEEIYTKSDLDDGLNPLKIKVRESRDSDDNPNSTPVIAALDVTGSMGMIADVIAREGLGTLFQGILERRPITDPHVMFMGVGDANFDRAPLQVSQFEAATPPIVEQLTKLYLEKGGGGNSFESYNLPWYFAANHTVHDSFEKRAKRGYLFTIGDEEAPRDLTPEQIKRFVGDDVHGDQLSTRFLLESAQRFYDVFHIVVMEGNHARMRPTQVEGSWKGLLGQRTILLSDHTKLAETIVSAIEVAEGVDPGKSSSGWGVGTSHIVHAAVRNLPRSINPKMIGK